MDRTERFYKIKELLRHRDGVNFATLMAELEVSRSTLKRDMAYLSTRLNNPIEWSREAGGYRLVESSSAVDKTHELPGSNAASTVSSPAKMPSRKLVSSAASFNHAYPVCCQ